MSDDGATCIEDCTDGKLLIRDVDKNFCGTECPGNDKYLLVPDNICNTHCDTSIYVADEQNKKCGLCKDMDTEKPYRFIGGNRCLSEDEILEGAYEYNTKLKLLKCKSGYQTDPSNVNSCITNYHVSCKTCSEYSNDDTNPKCLTCNNGYYIYNETCFKNITTTIITTIPKVIMPTTIIKIPTTIITTILITPPTTIITTIAITPPTTIITTIPKEKPSTIPILCPDEKCLTCNEQSKKLGLCLTCNEALGYKKVNYSSVLTNFFNCMKPENPQTKKFYYIESLKEYRPCYKTCKQCLKGGDAEKNYCSECESGYMFRPGNNPYNNCVVYS